MGPRPRHGVVTLPIAALLLILASASPLTAQLHRGPAAHDPGTFWLEARGGTAFTMGDLADFSERGGAWGAGVAWQAHERVRLRLDFARSDLPGTDWDNLKSLPGGGVVGPDAPDKGPATELTHLTGGVQLRLNALRDAWELLAHAGAGVAFLDVEETAVTEGGDFERFTLNGGLEIGYAVTPRVRFVGRGDVYLMLSRDAGPDYLGKELTLPFTAGLAVGL